MTAFVFRSTARLILLLTLLTQLRLSVAHLSVLLPPKEEHGPIRTSLHHPLGPSCASKAGFARQMGEDGNGPDWPAIALVASPVL